MKNQKRNQTGFIPMIIMLIVVLMAMIIFAYLRVKTALEAIEITAKIWYNAMIMSIADNIVGVFEKVSFPLLGVSDLVAKIDTGAYTGAMHCTKIEEQDTPEGKVVVFAPFGENGRLHSTDYFYTKHVKSSNGSRQKRYVVKTEIVIRGKTYPILLTLADRSDMKYQVLIGRRFLRLHKLVVDAT